MALNRSSSGTVTIMTYNEPYVMLFNNRRKLYLLSLEPVIINNTR